LSAELHRLKGGRCRTEYRQFPAHLFHRAIRPRLLAILSVIFSDPHGTQPANIALMSVLLAYLIALGTRGWRCATLVASGHQVTVRGLVTTTSVQWQHIDQFVADTRPTMDHSRHVRKYGPAP